MWQYKGMLFNPRYGRVGLIAMPFFAFGEMLAPLVEVAGYVITLGGLLLGAVNTNFALLFVLRSEEHTNSSHTVISYAVFCLKKKKKIKKHIIIISKRRFCDNTQEKRRYY